MVKKEGVDIDASVKVQTPIENFEDELINNKLVCDLTIDRIQLDAETRKIAVHVAGHVAKRIREQKKYQCCVEHVVGDMTLDNPDHDYIRILSRGGLTIPSVNFTEYVCSAFAILEYAENIISSSKLSARAAAKVILQHVLSINSGLIPRVSCDDHSSALEMFTNRVLINVFCNNRQKFLTGSVVKDKVAGFKKSKRMKKD